MFLGESWGSGEVKKPREFRYSVETELWVLAQGLCKGLWMKIILDDLK